MLFSVDLQRCLFSEYRLRDRSPMWELCLCTRHGQVSLNIDIGYSYKSIKSTLNNTNTVLLFLNSRISLWKVLTSLDEIIAGHSISAKSSTLLS